MKGARVHWTNKIWNMKIKALKMEKQWKSGYNVNNRPTETTYFALMLFTKHRESEYHILFTYLYCVLWQCHWPHTYSLLASLCVSFAPNSNIGTVDGCVHETYVIFEVNLALSNCCVWSHLCAVHMLGIGRTWFFEHWVSVSNGVAWATFLFYSSSHLTRWSMIYKCNEFTSGQHMA